MQACNGHSDHFMVEVKMDGFQDVKTMKEHTLDELSGERVDAFLLAGGTEFYLVPNALDIEELIERIGQFSAIAS